MKTQDFDRKFNDEIQELESQIKQKENIIKNLNKETGKLDVFFRRITEAITPIEPLTTQYIPDYRNLKAEQPLTYLSQYSDWHTGEVQDADEIEGFNEFNPGILDTRVENLDKITIKKATFDRFAYRVDRNHIICTGDMISGDIHEELKITNAYPVPVQIVEAAKKIAISVARRAAFFPEIVIDYIVGDNHARLTRKPQFKQEGMNSHNFVVGELAKSYLSKHGNVEFNIHPLHECVINVAGMKYLCSHGHDIRGWMGIPWYSVTRKLGKEAMARMQLIMAARGEEMKKMQDLGFHKFKFGHFHTYFDNDQYSCSSSMSGTNALDHADGRFGFPGQTMTKIHPEYGEIDVSNIKLN